MESTNNRLYQLARIQVDMVKSALGKRFTFEDNETNETHGGYTTYGTLKTPTAIVVVRLSNHICSMNNWTERYKQKLIANNKLLRRMGKNLQDQYKERCFYSIVFKAFDYQPNDNGKWKATCKEYVFNPLEVEKNGTIGKITHDCFKLNANQPISINGVNPTTRTTIAPKKSKKVQGNNQQLNCNTNMNKKLIKLTESDLHRIVKESVNKVLNEGIGRDIDDDTYFGGGLPSKYLDGEEPNELDDFEGQPSWATIDKICTQQGLDDIDFETEYTLVNQIKDLLNPLEVCMHSAIRDYGISYDDMLRFIRESLPNYDSLLHQLFSSIPSRYGWLRKTK